MANGQDPALLPQQEEQQQALITQQPVKPGLYQTLSAMSPEEQIKFKSALNLYKGQKEIVRNVGDKRGGDIITEVRKGSLTMKDAISMSKKELTPNMKQIDQAFYSTTSPATPQSFLVLKNRSQHTWTRNERNLWESYYADLINQDRREAVRQGKISQQQSEQAKYAAKAKVHYRNIEYSIEGALKSYFETDDITGQILQFEGKRADEETGEELSFTAPKYKPEAITAKEQAALDSAWDYITSEIKKDLTPGTYNTGNQSEIYRQLSVIANLVPAKHLEKTKVIIVGDEQIPVFEKQYTPEIKRKLYLDLLIKKVDQAKLQLGNIPVGEAGSVVAPTTATDWSAYEIQQQPVNP
jgi:hypothetical protein